MRWGFAIVLFAVAAHADQSTPELRGTPGISGRCAARFEQARDEIARRNAVYKEAIVEARAHETGAAGDPTSHRTVDILTLWLHDDMIAWLYLGPPVDEGFVNSKLHGSNRRAIEHAIADCRKMKTPQ